MISWRALRVKGCTGKAARLAAFAAALLLLAPTARAAPPRGNTPEEIEIGRQVSAEVDRNTRASTDTATVRRLNEIAAVIAPRTERPLITYDIRLIHAPVANAFSIPGGIIYFTDELVKEARSDDEIAGVMAHEMGHNTCQHVLKRMHARSTKAMQLADLLSLGIFVLTKGGGWGQAAQLGISSLTQSVMAANTVQDEKQADACAIRSLAGSPYTPVGFLTFMEHQATLQNEMEEEQMGFYRDHPFTSDRVLVARRSIEALGLPIDRRAVRAAPCAVVGMAPYTGSLELIASAPNPGREDDPPLPRAGESMVSNAPADATPRAAVPPIVPGSRRADSLLAPAVLYQGEVLYFPADHDTASQKTRDDVACLNRILDRMEPGEDLSVESGADGSARLSDREEGIEFTAAEARVNGTDAATLARHVRDRAVVFADTERRRVALLYYLIGNEKEAP